MSETAAETPAETVQEPVKQETDWKAEARKWQDRAKENKTAADRLAELEEANKTAEQRANERLEAAERRAAELEAKAAVAEASAETGVPADLLTGPASNSKEDLAAYAVKLIEHFKVPEPEKPVYGPYVPAEGRRPEALNGDGIENALRFALGI